MQIQFRTRQLERCYYEVGHAIREWGPVVGRRYVDRLSRLRLLDTVTEAYRVRQFDLHPLTGDRAGQHAVRLTGQMRLIVTVLDDQTIQVDEVVDYHG